MPALPTGTLLEPISLQMAIGCTDGAFYGHLSYVILAILDEVRLLLPASKRLRNQSVRRLSPFKVANVLFMNW